MEIDVQKLVNEYFPEALQETKNLLKIKSFKTAPATQAPFGQGTKEVLDYAINLGKKLGFKTYQDPENRYGFLDYGDDEKELFVILCHLDVVPPGNLDEWVTNPFEPIEKDGKLIGRGSFDDKGPTMMNLYALKYLKDQGFQSAKYKIRIIFGLTEETTWESIRAYLSDYGPAQMGYVPDGEFPVVYAEKWIVDFDLKGSLPADFEISGGDAYNVINDRVTYKGPKLQEIATFLNNQKIRTTIKDEVLTVQGKSGHGSMPWLGINAATYLASAMVEVGIDHPFINFIAQNVHLNYNCSNIFPSIKDETGDLTQNLGILEVRDGFQRATFNFRVPVFTKPETDFLPILKKAIAQWGLDGETIGIEDSVYVPKDSPMVKKIMQVYQDVTGDLSSTPLAIGGGTYAKAMPGLVAFGAEFNIEESTMHAYNEFVKISDLQKMLEIYAKAIVLLTQ